MSLFGALSSGVSGLSAQSSAMGAISDNLTNVNTIGYKGTLVEFNTLVTSQVSQTQFSPGGVQSNPKSEIDVQGLLQSSTNATDLALSGQGFFVTATSARPGDGDLFAYSRAGDFRVDDDGFLRNGGGFYLQAWSLLPFDGNETASIVNVGSDVFMKAYNDDAGNTTYVNDNIIDDLNLRPVNLNEIGGTAQPTQNIRFGANLPAGDPVFNPNDAAAGGRHSLSVLIFDSLGNSHNLNTIYTKTQENGWGMAVEVPARAATLVVTGSGNTVDTTDDVYSAQGQLEFTRLPSDGEFLTLREYDASGNLINVVNNDNPITFEFDTDGSLTQTTANVIRVDVSTAATVSDVATALNNAIQASSTNISSKSRFFDDGGRLGIVQSTMGTRVQIDASSALSIRQSNANIDSSTGLPTGIFEIPAIDAAYKNGAAIHLDGIRSGTLTAADDGAVLSITSGGNYTFEFDTNAGGIDTTIANTTGYTIDPTTNRITALTPGDLPGGLVAGDFVNISGSEDTGNDTGWVRVENVGVGFIEVEPGRLGIANADDDSMTIQTMTNGGIRVAIDPATATDTDVAAAIVNTIRNDTSMPEPDRFRADGNAIIFEQSSTGPVANVDTTGLAFDHRIIRVNDPEDPTDAGNDFPVLVNTINGENFNVVETPYGSLTPNIRFNSDGTPSSFQANTIEINWANGAEDMQEDVKNGQPVDLRLDLFMGNVNTGDGFTQLSGSFQPNFINQDGAKFGNFAGVSIGEDGIVTALFDNGLTTPIAQIPVATFVNPNDLESLTGNAWIETDRSGAPTLRTAGQGGAATIASAALEASTVDIGEEFTRMITTQQAYTSASKIISTTDEMLRELTSVVR